MHNQRDVRRFAKKRTWVTVFVFSIGLPIGATKIRGNLGVRFISVVFALSAFGGGGVFWFDMIPPYSGSEDWFEVRPQITSSTFCCFTWSYNLRLTFAFGCFFSGSLFWEEWLLTGPTSINIRKLPRGIGSQLIQVCTSILNHLFVQFM